MVTFIKCRKCNKKKLPNDFYLSHLKKHDFLCKKCSNIKSSKYAKLHPEKRYAYWRKQKAKHPRYCKVCGTEIKMDFTAFCSYKCKEIQIKINRKKYNDMVFPSFEKFKVGIGCAICGYSKCGGCLDFHHVNPEDKKRRITAKMWYSGSNIIIDEMQKCILLCKNCHYEIEKCLND